MKWLKNLLHLSLYCACLFARTFANVKCILQKCKILIAFLMVKTHAYMEYAGNQLRKAIKEKGLTQEEAAELLGVTRQTIGIWLKRQVFDANTLHRIRLKLGVNLDSTEEMKESDNINMPREVFDKISQLIDANCSQKEDISSLVATIKSQQGTIAGQQDLLSKMQMLVDKALTPPHHGANTMDGADSEGNRGSSAVG